MRRFFFTGLLVASLAQLSLGCGEDAVELGTAATGAGGAAATSSSATTGGGGAPTTYPVGPRRYGSYLGFDTQTSFDCTAALDFVFYEPEGSGPFPIFVFTKGTRGEWDADDLVHESMLKRMAARGFVAVSPNYQSNVDIFPGAYGLSCEGFREKSRCIFSTAHSESLIAVLERDTAADAGLGIVTAGVSQGGFVALLAADHHAGVRAAHPISIGTQCGMNLSTSACATPGGYTLLPERVRIHNGESDATFGGVTTPNCDGMQQIQPTWYRQELNAMTGQACPTTDATHECLRPGGGGWVLARDEQLVGGLAHHAFCYAEYPKTPDANWDTTGEAWGRQAAQDWLVTMASSAP